MVRCRYAIVPGQALAIRYCQFNQGTSKANNGARTAAFKELVHVIKLVFDTKNLRLKIKPTGNGNKPWEIVYFSNSDYTGDLVSRRSIGGFILYILGVHVSWQ